MLGKKGHGKGPRESPECADLTILHRTSGDAIRDDWKSPNPLFWVEAAGFRVDIFGRFFGVPLAPVKVVDQSPCRPVLEVS